jgi:hypothetical protein
MRGQRFVGFVSMAGSAPISVVAVAGVDTQKRAWRLPMSEARTDVACRIRGEGIDTIPLDRHGSTHGPQMKHLVLARAGYCWHQICGGQKTCGSSSRFYL